MVTSKLLFSLAATITLLATATPALAQHMNAGDAPCKAAGSGVDQANCLSRAAKKKMLI
jgi:hypothetical protein